MNTLWNLVTLLLCALPFVLLFVLAEILDKK